MCRIGTCSEPLGVGWNFTLPDSAFNASSSLFSGQYRESDVVSGDFVDHDAFIWSHYPVSVSLSLLIVSFQVRGTSVLTTDDCINRTIALRRESEAGAQESKITNSGYKWILGKSSSLQLLLHKVR